MAKEQLDISIENADKSPKKLALLVNTSMVVTEKVDGTKLTLIRNSAPYDADPRLNWIVAYKNNVINAEDFAGLTGKHDAEVSTHSVGISQYKFVWDGLKKNQSALKSVPPNTEFFVEFVMRKGTLTRQYLNYHSMLLIATSPTRYQEKSGKVFSQPSSVDTIHNEHYAKLLGITTPHVLFRGKLKDAVKSTKPEDMVQELKAKFLDLSSQFGGKMEGVVMQFDSGETFKLVQDDQYDKATRGANKAKLEPTDATSYWNKVRAHAEHHVNVVDPSDNMKKNLEKISHGVYGGDDLNLDSNKKSIHAKDDVFLTAKNILTRRTPGNNGALFLGRFSPLTIAHHRIIADALKKYDTVTVNIVKSKIDEKNPFPVEMQQKMLHACFGNKVDVIISSTGNLGSILQKPKNTINVVIAGSDRVDGYTDQLKHDKDIKVEEIPRKDEVSGTLVRKYLRDGNRVMFRKYVPPEVFAMYEELKSIIDGQK